MMMVMLAPSRLKVSSCGSMFGTRWVNMIRQVRVPESRAATTNGRSRRLRAAARDTRAKAGMLKADSAQMTWISLGPSPSAIASTSTSDGKAMNTSRTRIRTASSQPPAYAATSPSRPPIVRPMTWTAAATTNDTRPPYRILDMMSLPTMSVPKMCPLEKSGRSVVCKRPPTGLGTMPNSGQMKQKNSSSRSTVPGMTISAERSTPRRRAPGSPALAAGTGTAVARMSAAGTDMTNPWVEHTVSQIGEQVGEDHGDAEDEHDALDDRDVPVADRLQQLLPDAGQREDLLDDHRRPDQRRDVKADDREQADERVPQCVPGEDAPLTDALRPRGDDVVLGLHLLQQVGAQEPGVEADERQSQDDAGQRELVHVAEDRRRRRVDGREDRQVDGEDNHQEEGQHIGRDGDTAHRQHHVEPVEDPARPTGAEHGQRDRHHERDDQGEDHQFQRHWQPLAEDRRDRLRAGDRGDEVAVHHSAEPVPVAGPQRLVEMQLDAERPELFRRRVDAEQCRGGVTRQGVENEKAEERDAPKDGDGGQQPPAADPEGRRPGQAARTRAARPACRLNRNRSVHVGSDLTVMRWRCCCCRRTARGSPGSRR